MVVDRVPPLALLFSALVGSGAAIAAAASPATAPGTGVESPATPPAKASPQATASPPLSKWRRAQLELYNNSAPADEYFGKLKLSFLGINNTYRDAAISSGEHTIDPVLVAKVEFADDALRAWAAKYPRDPQLARSYFLAIASDRKIWLKANQDRVWIYMNRIVSSFGDTYFGKLVQRDMALGYTEHYYAAAQACPTAEPTPTLAPTATPTPLPTPTPPPARHRVRATPTPKPVPPTLAPTPVPTSSPSPTPSPVPTPQVLGKGLSLVIETPPCVAATATPAPTKQPALAPAPQVTAMPQPALTSAPPPATPAAQPASTISPQTTPRGIATARP